MFRQVSCLLRTLWKPILLGIMTASLYASTVGSVSASPQLGSAVYDEGTVTLRVARAQRDPNDPNQYCVKWLVGTFGLEQFTRIALASEIDNSSEAAGGMKAMSLVIRGLGVFHATQEAANYHGACPGYSSFSYDLDDTRVAFRPLRSSLYDPGNSGNKPNDRVTDTMGEYMQPQNNGQDIWVFYNDCMHNKMNTLAGSISDPEMIVKTAYENPGACANATPCVDVDPYHCEYSQWRTPTYYLQQGLKSMTNRVAARTPAYSSHNTSSFGFNQAHQAEVFWGNDMPYGQVNPHGQPGTYIISTGHATLTEYLVSYGWGTSATLYVNGISDKPQPVIANVYIDGYYCCWLDWNENDNQRHLDSAPLPYKGAGLHTIAIQFREAAWLGGGEDGTRWLYLDDLGVVP